MILHHSFLFQILLFHWLSCQAVSRLYAGEGDDEEYVRVLVGFHDRREEEAYVMQQQQQQQPSTASGKPKTKILYEFGFHDRREKGSYMREQQRQSHSASGKPKIKILHEFQSTEALAMEVTRAELEQMRKDNTFSYIEEDLEVPVARHEAVLQNNDNYEFVSYGIERTQADRSFDADPTWDQQCGVYLCVVDSGVYLNHNDIPYSRGDGYVDGKSFGPAQGQDWSNPIGNSHGTEVGGIMIAAGGNDRGIMGVIPEGPGRSNVCLRVPKVVADQETNTFVSALLEASEWCAEQAGDKPLVINLSFAVAAQTATERAIYQRLYDKGVLIVASAGNFGNSRQTFPGGHNSVVSVASVGAGLRRSVFSVFNDDVELTAPGENIVVLQAGGNGVAMINGTSFSSPFVAGLAARIWTGVPRCSNIQLRQALRDTALRLGEGVPNREYGYGLIQAQDARDLLMNSGCNNLSEEELLELEKRRRFRDVLQSRGPNFADRNDNIRIKAQDWLIRDPQFNSYSDDRLMQRWVLAVLAYGFQLASSPQALQNWVQYTNECSWFHTLGEDGGTALCNSNGLYVRLDLRKQNLVGTLPPELALLSNHLRMIHLFDNLIYGELPSELGLLANLERLEVTQNSFSGELPPELCNLAKLTFMGLGRNSFWGEIPEELGKLSRMKTLSLERNMFQREIPSELGNLRDLTILELQNNSLTGIIPPSFGQLSNLKYLNLVHNEGLWGKIPGDLCQLEMVSLGADCEYVECFCCTSCNYYR